MSRAAWLLLLACGLVWAGLVSLNAQIAALAVPLLAYLALAAGRASATPQLSVTRHLSEEWMPEGSLTQATVTVVNLGPALERVWLVEPIPAGLTATGRTRLLTTLPAGGRVTLTYTLTGRRGVYRLPPTQVETGETLGLFRRRTSWEAEVTLVIAPETAPIRAVPLRPRRTLGFSGPLPARQSGSGAVFFGVRPYAPGDPLRRINWRATARHGDDPFTTTFEQERIAEVGLIVDARLRQTLVVQGRSLLEHGVRAAAALAEAALRDGHRVGLLLYGQGAWVAPGYGRVQRSRILQALAGAQPANIPAFDNLKYLPIQLFPPGSQLLFVSPLLAEDETMLLRLRAYGYSVAVVSPDPVRYEATGLSDEPLARLAVRLARLERQLSLQRLRQGGVAVVDWDVAASLDDTLQTALRALPPDGVWWRPGR